MNAKICKLSINVPFGFSLQHALPSADKHNYTLDIPTICMD